MTQQHEQFAEVAEYYKKQKGTALSLNQETTVAFLRETQEIYGYIPAHALETIALCSGYKVPLLQKIIKLYPSLKASDAAHEIVVCSGGRCGSANAALLSQLKKGLENFAPNTVELRTQNCFKQCGKGPNIQVDGVLYNHCDKATVEEILKKLKQ